MSDKNLTELFTELSETHRIEAGILGDPDTNTEAAIAKGKSDAYDIASQVAVDAEDAQADLHQFETIDTEKLLRHPDRRLYNVTLDADHRQVLEGSPICEDIEVIDDQTIEVALIVDLPEQL